MYARDAVQQYGNTYMHLLCVVLVSAVTQLQMSQASSGMFEILKVIPTGKSVLK